MHLTLPPIPWGHSTTGLGSVWQWTTPHFRATVTGDNRSCYWNLVDLSDGRERLFADGRTSTFAQSERQVRETVGKAYDPRLGYQHYAGPLATTFTISTGEQVDLAPYHNRPVEVAAITPDGGTANFVGTGRVSHYHFVVTQGEQQARISPTYIVNIAPPRRVGQPKPGRTNSRTFEGAVVPGCTGRPGFLTGTVEHVDLWCPIHEN